MKVLLSLALIYFLTSCGHTQLEFQSYPQDVNVSVVDSKGQIKKLGVTPLEYNAADLFKNESMVKIVFSKLGHKDEVIYLNKPQVPSKVVVAASMNDLDNATELLSSEKLERVSSRIAEAQKHSYNKNFSKAKQILTELIDDYPEISVPYDLMGNIHFLTNEYNTALYFYQKAKELSPRNNRRDQLINKLKITMNR